MGGNVVLDSHTGKIVMANAGHCLPYVHHSRGVAELRATGLPLGLMPETDHDEVTSVIEPGQGLVLYSDGLAEAHGVDGSMFGVPRVMGLSAGHAAGDGVIDVLLRELPRFAGPAWEVGDDVTLVSVSRSARDNGSGVLG